MEEEKNDYFEDAEVPEKPAEVQKPTYTPDDPRYWEEPEDEFEHLRPSRRINWKLWAWLLVSAVAIGLLWAGYIRLFHPCIREASQSGYIEKLDKRGDTFITFEGVMLPYRNLMDTMRSYDGDFEFSVTDPAVAAQLQRMLFDNRPVRVHYREYHVALPWRGDTRRLVESVDSVNPQDLLPPDRQPASVMQPNDDK